MPDYLEMLRGLLGAFGPREAEARMRPMDDRASRMLEAQRQGQAPAPGSHEAEAPLTGRWYSPERRSVYQAIGRAAEAHPDTAKVWAEGEWPKKHANAAGLYFPGSDEIAVAPMEYEYHPPITVDNKVEAEEMAYNLPAGTSSKQGLPPTDPTAFPSQDILAHEQLHFLMQKLMEAEQAEAEARRTGMSRRAANNDFRRGVGTGVREAYDSAELQHQLIAYLLGGQTAEPFIKQNTYPEPMSGTHPPASSPEVADAYRRLIYQIFPEEQRRAKALAGLGATRGGTLLEELR